MARFNFRLQQFLGIKEQLETLKEIEYGQAIRRLEEEKQKKLRLLAERQEHIDKFREALARLIVPVDIRRYNNYLERLKNRIIQQDERIAAAEAYKEKKRLELVEAMKERKALETVREHRLEEFTLETKLAEQKVTDEMVSYKYGELRK